MTKKDFFTEQMDVVELGERRVLFTEERVAQGWFRQNFPGLFAYDVRETEGMSGIPCTVEKAVRVNHFGTIVTDNPIVEVETNGLLQLEVEEPVYREDTDGCINLVDMKKVTDGVLFGFTDEMSSIQNFFHSSVIM